jgi:hypothetical protein
MQYLLCQASIILVSRLGSRSGVGLLLSILLTGCTASSLVRPGFRLPPAQGLAFVSPVTTVAVRRYNNAAATEKAATLESARLLSLALLQHRAELRLRNEVTIPDSLLLQARHELYEAVLGIEQHWQLGGGANLPALDYLLRQQRQRYALLTVASGFTQVPKQAPSSGGGGIRLGSYPFSSSSATMVGQPKSNIYLLIYDQQRQAIVYYRHTPPLASTEPLEAASLEKQFKKLLRKDFRTPEKPD